MVENRLFIYIQKSQDQETCLSNFPFYIYIYIFCCIYFQVEFDENSKLETNLKISYYDQNGQEDFPASFKICLNQFNETIERKFFRKSNDFKFKPNDIYVIDSQTAQPTKFNTENNQVKKIVIFANIFLSNLK